MWTPRSEPLLTESQIRERIGQLADRILADLGTDEPFVVAGLLRGCLHFTSDLVRELSRRGGDVEELDFIVCSSYGDGMTSSRKLDIKQDLSADIQGKRVLLIDDIIDTGHTLLAITDYLRAQAPEFIRTVVLLDKPERREAPIEADYAGFTIANEFVIGYGLDYAQQYRELPYITVMEQRGD